ncbi:nicotinate-nucleotide pyrophosphorylase [Thermosipho affectus]|uniref:nicotinate-nucleotide diphosphorylase (carboxylating) n=1 Tax=Thermosipho affectus TaxID=660294 RepID=A0ABX3IF67_9BACT|nr:MULTISPECIES: carboxylating nicotinate-nucleotide diphosphorylase [Thermosipho]ANQ54420.1 nicotinate-nucleotide pyrophosphorylase [Thermosipho sp. 1070]APT72864.1 nicotinate-nucleotide pyrophosphorylase [Thermosipho sp. 1063]ONN26462.1 nicotinate-nucleotide pyrophosphorylase [Thermosipho affectus]
MINKIIEWIEKDEGLIDFASYPLKNKYVEAEIVLKQDAVLSGIKIVKHIFKHYDLEYKINFHDGDFVKKDSILLTLNGNAYNILVIERTVLNILSLMSGIATKVRKFVDIAKDFGITISATRKIIPLIGDLEKLAVLDGGGNTHRLNLSDTVMIKDNHKKIYGSIKKAVNQISKIKPFTSKIEVEIENFKELEEVLDLDVDIVMLDNFNPKDAKKAVELIKNKKNIIVEVSGGICEENLKDYLINGVDVISIGRLTSEIKYIDISMEIC